MAKTYDPSQLTTSEVYQVRFLIGDTNAPPYVTPATAVLDDDEISWLLSTEANVYMAAAAAAERVVSVINGGTAPAGVITRKRVGQTDISYANGKSSADYTSLATQLRRRSGHQVPFAGGISAADKLSREQDSDRPAGRLTLNQFDRDRPWPLSGSDLLDT